MPLSDRTNLKPSPLSAYVLAWIALLVLLAASCASSFIPMGRMNAAVNLGIAAAKALIVIVAFMHLPRARPIVWIAAAAGIVWLAILASLGGLDFAIRLH